MIWDVHSGSRIRIQIFSASWIRTPDPGVKKAQDPGSATLLTNILFGCTKCPCLRLWKKTVLNVELIS
jgi:hypothetical protein